MINVDLCKNCVESSLEKSDKIFTEKTLDELEDYYLNFLQGEIIEKLGRKVLVLRDNKNILFDHSRIFVSDRVKKLPLGNMEKGLLKETEIVKNYLKGELSSLRFQYLSSRLLNSPFITDSNAHSKLLVQANEINENALYNQALNNLHFDTPIFEGVSLNKVIKFREYEEEAFTNYRNGINKTLKSYIEQKDAITPNLMNEFYSDLIAPEIRTLDNKIKNTKSLAAKKLIGTASVASVAIGVGLTTNFVTVDALKSLGLFTFLGSSSTNVIDYLHKPADVKNSDYYFLWKVKNS